MNLDGGIPCQYPDMGMSHAVIRIWKSACQDPDLGQGMPGSRSHVVLCMAGPI
jgi:hypothetical protein